MVLWCVKCSSPFNKAIVLCLPIRDRSQISQAPGSNWTPRSVGPLTWVHPKAYYLDYLAPNSLRTSCFSLGLRTKKLGFGLHKKIPYFDLDSRKVQRGILDFLGNRWYSELVRKSTHVRWSRNNSPFLFSFLFYFSADGLWLKLSGHIITVKKNRSSNRKTRLRRFEEPSKNERLYIIFFNLYSLFPYARR